MSLTQRLKTLVGFVVERRAWSHRFAILTVSQGLRIVNAFGILPLLSRSTTREEFGQYVFAFSSSQFIALICDFGLSSTALRTLSRSDTQSLDRQLPLAFGIRALIGLAATTLAMVACFFIFGNIPKGLFAMMFLGVCASQSITWYLNATKRYSLILISEGLPVLLMFATTLLVLNCSLNIYTIFYAGGIGWLVPALIATFRRRRSSHARPSETSEPRLSAPLIDAGVGLSRIVGAIYSIGLIPLARITSGDGSIALYTACEKLGSVAGVVALVIAQLIAPHSARIAANSRELAKLARVMLVLEFGAGALYVAIFGGFGARLVRIVFGPTYAHLNLGALLAALAGVIAAASTINWSGILVPAGRSSKVLAVSVVGALASMSVLFLLRNFGYIGIILARTASELAVLIPSLWVIVKLSRDRSPVGR